MFLWLQSGLLHGSCLIPMSLILERTVVVIALRRTDMTNEERSKFRREASLAFTVASCDRKGMATENDIRYAVLQADRLIKHLDKPKDELTDG